MIADDRFLRLPLEFWALVRVVSQRLGYSESTTIHDICRVLSTVQVRVKLNDAESWLPPDTGVAYCEGKCSLTLTGSLSPELESRLLAANNRGVWKKAIARLASLSREFPAIDTTDLIVKGEPTGLGELVAAYINHRVLTLQRIAANLMDREEARVHFERLRSALNPRCALPMNKQKKEKQHHAYLTGIVNILTERELGNSPFDDNPRGLVTLSKDGKVFRAFSRWFDGAYPGIHDPHAVWEVKEYYGTTTFGSRVADGVYESMLDGLEVAEAASHGCCVRHYLIVDDRFTWWEKGKSYLCRLIDILHMGLVDEILFGREVLHRWPEIVRSWRAVTK